MKNIYSEINNKFTNISKNNNKSILDLFKLDFIKNIIRYFKIKPNNLFVYKKRNARIKFLYQKFKLMEIDKELIFIADESEKK